LLLESCPTSSPASACGGAGTGRLAGSHIYQSMRVQTYILVIFHKSALSFGANQSFQVTLIGLGHFVQESIDFYSRNSSFTVYLLHTLKVPGAFWGDFRGVTGTRPVCTRLIRSLVSVESRSHTFGTCLEASKRSTFPRSTTPLPGGERMFQRTLRYQIVPVV
jgi:hypothetical protein